MTMTEEQQSKPTADDVTETPLSSTVERCLAILSSSPSNDNSTEETKNTSAKTDQDTEDDAAKQSLAISELVRCYTQLDAVDRYLVDRQLVDILYRLTTRGLDVNAFCDSTKRKTALHLVAAAPDTTK